MRKKGFTLVELLVVIAIIALLIGILMPALAKVKSTAYQMICGTNLAGIGKAMLLYAPEYQDEFPKSGSTTTSWAIKTPVWNAATKREAFGLDGSGLGGTASISSVFYLLVKYSDVSPKTFVCKSLGGTVWEPSKEGVTGTDLTVYWDFGTQLPKTHCNYAYHLPFYGTSTSYQLMTNGDPGLAVAADWNPFLSDMSGSVGKAFADYKVGGTSAEVQNGNSAAHQNNGQNVMFLDAHVEFAKAPDVGINQDNIYTLWSGTDIRKGAVPSLAGKPTNRSDSYLVSDTTASGSGGGGTKGVFCFIANTPVWVDGAFVQISKVTAGQVVEQGSTVGKLQEHEGTYELRNIELTSGNTIGVVGQHRFMLASGVWMGADKLQSGMTLKTMNGTVGIKSVTLQEKSYSGTVYNIQVSNSDQYMVGEDAVVVRDW